MRSPNLREMIDMFLEEPRKSLSGGWAEITERDVGVLKRIVRELISLKCDKDADGDYPIQVKLINRRVYEADHFFPVPYEETRNSEGHYVKTMPFLDRLRLLMGNLNCAQSRLDTAVLCQRLEEGSNT